jgi:hypothetical protein
MEAATQLDPMREHCDLIAESILEGRVVPFLGAGVNLCDRPQCDPPFTWTVKDTKYLPSGWELACHLAARFYPNRSESNLTRVAQYAEVIRGTGVLYDELDFIFRRAYPTTSVHQFLAALPAPAILAREESANYPLVVTTNYDLLMEAAYEESHQEYDLVFFKPEAKMSGQRPAFWHRPPGQDLARIDPASANKYPYPFCEQRPTVLKIHGSVDMQDKRREGFVITEDDYIDYIEQEPLEQQLPQSLRQKLQDNHFLFLGYSLSDWNLRVFLRRLRKDLRSYESWAVMRSPGAEEIKAWVNRGVDVKDCPLSEYVALLREALNSKLEAARKAAQ